MPISAIIIEDEELAIKRIEILLQDFTNIDIKCSCNNGLDAIEQIEFHKPELIFLDIQLKDMSGFDILERLKIEKLPLIIFITAFNNFALKAFEVFAFDYLLKPFKDDRFYKSVYKAIDHINTDKGKSFNENVREMLSFVNKNETIPLNTNQNLLPIKLGNKTQFVKSDSIKYISASGYYAEIYTTEKKHLLRESLSNLISILDKNYFIRIHRSTIINTAYVLELINSSYGEIDIKMKDNKIFRISKSYKKEFLKKMGL